MGGTGVKAHADEARSPGGTSRPGRLRGDGRRVLPGNSHKVASKLPVFINQYLSQPHSGGLKTTASAMASSVFAQDSSSDLKSSAHMLGCSLCFPKCPANYNPLGSLSYTVPEADVSLRFSKTCCFARKQGENNQIITPGAGTVAQLRCPL